MRDDNRFLEYSDKQKEDLSEDRAKYNFLIDRELCDYDATGFTLEYLIKKQNEYASKSDPLSILLLKLTQNSIEQIKSKERS